MFISWGGLGQNNIWYIFGYCSRSHLLKKPGWGLPDSGGLASCSAYCAGLLGTSPVDGFCGHCSVCTTDFLGMRGVVARATRFTGVVVSVTGTATGAAGADLTGGIPGEHSGVAGATSVMVDLSGLTASG